MLNSGHERDKLHYNISEDDGYNCNINCILSPREPGKTTTMMLDKFYSAFKKGLPSVYLVNQPVEITTELCTSFETKINEFKGYEIETKYPKGGATGDITTVYGRFTKDENFRPFVYIIAFSTPETRLKRIVLGKIGLMWYDECNVNVTLGEKWPPSIGTKFNTLYTTLARGNYPESLKFYMTGNFYTRYNPILVYLGVNVNKIEIGHKFVTHQEKMIGDLKVTYDILVDAYQLKPELREFILKHNPGYAFDDTYQKYFEGKAIGEVGVPIEENRPNGYSLKSVFKCSNRFLYIWMSTSPESPFGKYWIQVTDDQPSQRRDIWVISLNDLQGNSILAKSFKNTFERLKIAISRMDVSFNSPEAFYLIQNVYNCI